MNIRLPLFGALGVRTGALTWSHVWAWQIGVIIAIVEPQSKSHKSYLAIVLLEWLKILEKQWPTLMGFNPHPPRLEKTAKAMSRNI